MLNIDNIVINDNVFTTKFTCNLEKCKGACCTMESSYGAPLKKDEIPLIEKVLPEVINLIPEEHRKEIETNGWWEEKDGVYMTRSVDDQACVFVYFEENGIAKCAIEKAYFKGKIDFRKPVSCHLFPIRVTDFGGPVLYFEQYDDCRPAIEYGQKTGIKVFDFCKDALEREYGTEWVEKVKDNLR